MTKLNSKTAGALCATMVALVVAFPAAAGATAYLRIEETGGPSVTVNDSATPGQIMFTGTVGDFVTNVVLGFTKPTPPNSANEANVALNDTHIEQIGTGTHTLVVTFADTDFFLGSALNLTAKSTLGSGTLFGSGSVTAESWINPNDLSPLPAGVFVGIPGGSIPILGPSVYTTNPFSDSGTANVFLPGLFSLFEQTSVTVTGPTLAIYNFSTDVPAPGPNITQIPVPEPATLVMLGTGLLGIAGVARRRRRLIRS